MKHLIIYAHPHEGSLNHLILETAVSLLLASGNEVVVRDLYALQFDPVLSLEDMAGQRKGTVHEKIAEEQDFIRRADALTFIYPIWWTGLPAMMKGYIDRVMSYGFAYRYDEGVQKGLLTGKKAYIFNSHGKSKAEYEASGMDRALLLTSDQGIYSYCGLEIKSHLFFDKADRPGKEAIARWKLDIEHAYR